MPRRKSANSTNALIAIVIGVFFLWLLLRVIISPVGDAAGITVIVVALMYGSVMAWRQASTRRLWERVRDLKTLSGPTFETHVAETFRRLGYSTKITRASRDGGADVIAESGADRIAIQCKQWSSTIGNDAVQQAYTAKAIYRCNRAVVICTSGFSADAQKAARATGVELFDGGAYARLMQQVGPRRNAPPPLIPTGRPLLFEAMGIGIGVLFLIVHWVGQGVSARYEFNRQLVTKPIATPQITEQGPAGQTVYGPPAVVVSSTPRNAGRTRPSPIPHAKGSINRPPWWTPSPVVTLPPPESTGSAPSPTPTAGVSSAAPGPSNEPASPSTQPIASPPQASSTPR